MESLGVGVQVEVPELSRVRVPIGWSEGRPERDSFRAMVSRRGMLCCFVGSEGLICLGGLVLEVLLVVWGRCGVVVPKLCGNRLGMWGWRDEVEV